MVRFTIQLFGVTVFALALIWIVGTGEAVQFASNSEPVLWADTVHINTEESGSAQREVGQRKVDNFYRDIKSLHNTALQIKNNYMEEVESDEIIKAGIRGMLSDLDRFSVLMEKSSYDALMESTHGKYEGLGMQIDARDDHIIIVSPIEGTPAYRKGLRAGDVIWEINGEPTEGMSSSDASKMMRGKAGTSVNLTIKRAGIEDLIEFEVERAVIELKSVNYYGTVPGTEIGYVRLSRFAEETSHELREAINNLKNENISGLIFDLRNNGGGLLDQAIETSELFLPQGSEIVYTKGKFEDSERHYYSDKPPVMPDKPLIILVDQGTASASEIVSGAIQDWDRGLIIGNNTYGKGLVQQIFNISQDGSMALKLTTAKYYVPSGRCIQKEEKQYKADSPHAEMVEEEMEKEASDTLDIKSEEEIFYTNGGRIVYGGGGIVPDIEVDREYWKPIEINLERQSIFFDYAVKYVADHPNTQPDNFEVTDEMVAEFKAFMKEKEFDYKTSLQLSLEKLQKDVEEEDNPDLFSGIIDSLTSLVAHDKDNDFTESIDYIKRTIKREIVASIAGERGVYEQIVLKEDKTVQRAIDILTSPNEYSDLLAKGTKKAEL